MNPSILSKYFPELSSRQHDQFALLGKLYEEWNAKINVISRKDLDQLYIRHVLHSLSIAKIITFKPETRLLDIGTGGGFPGIPLAIMFPEAQFHLVDSIGKKIKVVQSISAELGLHNVEASHIRAEKVDGQYDFVVCRAVTRLKTLIQWTRGKINRNSLNELNNGLICLKGGDLDEEIYEAQVKCKIFQLHDLLPDPFFETKKILYVPLG